MKTLKVASYFHPEDVDAVIANLQQLKDGLRPVRYGISERFSKRMGKVDDIKAFGQFREKNPLGYFLFSERFMYNITKSSVTYANMVIYPRDANIEKRDVLEMFGIVAEHHMIFGYACESSEYDYRNRYYKTIGNSSIEAWVGRDLRNTCQAFTGSHAFQLLSFKG